MYIATLRPKEGELRALDKLKEYEFSNRSFIPNFIIGDFSSELLNSIKKKYEHDTLLDVRNLDVDDIETLEELLNNDTNDYSQFDIVYPIETLLYAENDMPSVKYVRISKRSINGFFIQWLNSNSSLLPNNIIIDFEDVDDKVPESLISSVIQIINQIGDKNVTILSGAIPQSLPVKANENYKLKRYEKELYNKICSLVDIDLIYGDYCTVSPRPLAATGPIIPIVQIKYTLQDEYWFVRNGQRRGNYNFVAVCEEIVNTIPLFNPNYCWGSNFIQNVVDEYNNKGNPSVWASIGINHHIHFCIDETI